ncbi:MAG: GreA/GreB family elongation factor [Candidatus Pacebacteria bacterium]|nr:GreA/GreB family elongation factor [Candidatus Paceibacterota bacterium]
MNKYIVTEKEYKEIGERIKKLEIELREVMKEKGSVGSEVDSWHDEGFKLAVMQQHRLSKRLGELEDLFMKLEIIEPKEQKEQVYFGTGVEIEYDNGEIFKFILVGYQITNDGEKVSIYSPLGQAILGAKVGERRIFQVGEKIIKVTIKKILSPSEVNI